MAEWRATAPLATSGQPSHPHYAFLPEPEDVELIRYHCASTGRTLSEIQALDLEELYHRPWAELQAAAWAVRQAHHPDVLTFARPGRQALRNRALLQRCAAFCSISVTGHFVRAAVRALPGPAAGRHAARA